MTSAHPETGLLGIGGDESAYLILGETKCLHEKVGWISVALPPDIWSF